MKTLIGFVLRSSIVIAFVSCISSSLFAQFDSRFTRTESTGHWNDGNWHKPAGNTAIKPTFDSDVYIAEDSIFTQSESPATVQLYTTETIRNLFVGPAPSMGNNDLGEINIATGRGEAGDPITSGTLNVSETAALRQGLININRGSSFWANNLTVSSGASAVNNQGLVSFTDAMVSGGGAINTTNGGVVSSGGTITVTTGGSFNIDGRSSMSATGLTVDGSTSRSMLSGDINLDSLVLTNGAALEGGPTAAIRLNQGMIDGSEMTVAGDIRATGNFDLTSGAVLNLSPGTLAVDGVLTIVDSDLVRKGGLLDVNELVVSGPQTIDLISGDSISGDVELTDGAALSFVGPRELSSLALENGSQTTVSQAGGELEGADLGSLVIDANSSLAVVFDAASPELVFDWALRVDGDQRALLNSYLDQGQLTVSGIEAGKQFFVVYDQANYGDFTYISAVPEPASGLVLLAFAVGGLSLRRRTKTC